LSLSQSGPQPDAVGFVLAGGQSSRMGADKALVPFDGQPLVARALGILREAGLTAAISGPRSLLAAYAPVVEDSEPGCGPLGGVCAALASSSAPHAVFLPVDLPLMSASLVAFLLDHARITGAAVTVPSVNGFAQTFPAVVDRATLQMLETRRRSGDHGCFSAFEAAAAQLSLPFSVLPVELLVQSGHIAHPDSLPAALWFLNVNSPGDLARAQAILAASYRVS
jgi:molybdopterin-guanine dinucleotide biosynthesis protein A